MFCKTAVRNITATLFVAAFLFGGCYDGVSGETGTVNSAESLKTVTLSSLSSPFTATPIPDSKWVSNLWLSVMS